jgi:hypothetical protein
MYLLRTPHLAATGDFGNLSKIGSHPGNTPKVRKSRMEIRAKRTTVAAEWVLRMTPVVLSNGFRIQV